MNVPLNFLTIVVDSCRYDTYRMANTPTLDKYFDVVEGEAQATFTFPAHAAMMQGFYPSTKDNRPLYNRFVMTPFQWHYSALRENLVTVPKNGRTIPESLSKLGWRTVCIGGVGWFRKPSQLECGFDHFAYVSNTNRAISEFITKVDREPFYGILNFGVTHRPYQCPDMPDRLKSRQSPRSGVGHGSAYDYLLHSKQAYCMGWLDKQLGVLLDWIAGLKSTTIVCLCGDHGECFGEDGCFGHAFYHPNVMSVPLAWSVFNKGNGQPVNKTLLRTMI